ncbi:hypothetical protein DPMN_029488 [Dreissena polymorpha]|uniref:Uncharacterized protein n=1 Tax=Dreissena polymorpha TaxID=45954 RepID=A0A9D4LY98_DREPO|nr:hypothetical protein DPMN_029488 [Dreissena polymorpha]
MARQRPTRGAPGLILGPCIVEIDRIVITYVQYEFEVSNFGWAWSMWARAPQDRIVIRDVQYQFEVNHCRNEEVIVKGNFGWAWSMWAGVPQVEIDRIAIRDVQYQFEINWCRNEEDIVKGNFWWAWSMWAGRPRIDRIVIRDVQYQVEVNGCRNEEFQGSSAYSVGGDSCQDGRADGQTDSGDNSHIPTHFKKRGDKKIGHALCKKELDANQRSLFYGNLFTGFVPLDEVSNIQAKE